MDYQELCVQIERFLFDIVYGITSLTSEKMDDHEGMMTLKMENKVFKIIVKEE